jgi:hypothetical protein
MLYGLHQTNFLFLLGRVLYDAPVGFLTRGSITTYTFMQVDCVFAGNNVGDCGSRGGGLFRGGFGFGCHYAGDLLRNESLVVCIYCDG